MASQSIFAGCFITRTKLMLGMSGFSNRNDKFPVFLSHIALDAQNITPVAVGTLVKTPKESYAWLNRHDLTLPSQFRFHA